MAHFSVGASRVPLSVGAVEHVNDGDGTPGDEGTMDGTPRVHSRIYHDPCANCWGVALGNLWSQHTLLVRDCLRSLDPNANICSDS